MQIPGLLQGGVSMVAHLTGKVRVLECYFHSSDKIEINPFLEEYKEMCYLLKGKG